ncbi:MAG TPA: cytochrome c biogenesis protein CcsA [Flavobacteriales bacterium]|nr:cytochrome c biogenesis protein CcsA [Flavobacteriales bacterium]
MKTAWWKIITIVLLLYSVIGGMWIRLVPAISGVSKPTISEGDQVHVYVYNGTHSWGGGSNPRSNTYLRVWTIDSPAKNAVTWEAKATSVSEQVVEIEFPESPYAKNQNLHLVLETPAFRDTLFNAFYFKVKENAKEGVLAVEKINPLSHTHKIFGFPNREILNETIRNLFFHVPIWFAMMLAGAIGMWHGFLFLRKGRMDDDIKAEKYLKTTVLMGMLGLVTGSIWARFTWGTWWTFDVKLNGAAITVLIYVAYLVLRSGVKDEIQRAKISGVYSIFAFFMMLLFVMIVPRIYDSLHPGNGGNNPVSDYDFDNTLRMVFYPACIAWMGLACWISQLNIRYQRLKNLKEDEI